MEKLKIDQIKWDSDGLLPAILQDAFTGEVLMLAYMNREALERTLSSRTAWFWSRSRQGLWQKGETSGNIQRVMDGYLDCDRDTLLLKVLPQGPACHLGTKSCFGPESTTILEKLRIILAERNNERPEGSYTTYLYQSGLDKILKKVGEESAEVIIASKNKDQIEIAQEMADLVYHLMVLLECQSMNYTQIGQVLQERMK